MKSQSNHILGQYDPLLVFTRSGPDLLALNDDTLETKLNQASDHFLWDELMYDSASGAVTLPMPELFSVVYDTILHDYVLIYKRVGSGIWVFYTVDVTSGVTTLVSSIPIDPDMPLVDIRYGYLYGLRGAMTGLVELVRTPLSSLPSSISWQPVATFSGVSYPGDIGQARLFHYHSNKMYLLEEGFNRLTVYDTLVPTAAASFAKVPPVPCTSFDVWADGYITFSHKSSSFMGTYTSDKPGYDPTHSYRPNVEISSGQSKFIAVGNDVTGLAVKSDGRWVTSNANVASHNLYATGSAVYWTKTPFAWDVPSTYTRVFNIAWEGLDLTGFDDVRIGFVLSSAGNTIPSTLVGWTGTSWYTFLTSNIAFDGAPLSSVATMELNGTQVVGYALYVKKSDPFKSGYIINNFLFDYQLSSIVSPIPMSFDGAHDSLKVEISPNLMKLTNVNDRDIHGLMVVVNQVP